jgi:hypothetical protein
MVVLEGTGREVAKLRVDVLGARNMDLRPCILQRFSYASESESELGVGHFHAQASSDPGRRSIRFRRHPNDVPTP